ncbi:hypothetical protein PLEOSDRAFT_1083173 [Pleurotus ostreatus PC15]|nr:hypothetical protein PLEOSDRAFT_1083173 [Pleurotus ostreatus PC15]
MLKSLTFFELPKVKVPMPQSLFVLTVASLLGASVSLIVSMLDLGVLSLYVTPPVSAITIIFLSVVLVVAHRKREEGYPSYYSTTILCAYIVSIGWLVGFITTMVVLVKGEAVGYQVNTLNMQGVAANAHTQRLQCFLTFVEFTLVGGLGLCGHLIARKEGEPDSWRPMAEVTETTTKEAEEGDFI